MENLTLAQGVETRPPATPVIGSIALADVRQALRAGFADFRAAPGFGLFFGGFFAAGGIAILSCLFLLDLVYLAYPLAAGYGLIGPFAAAGLYEVSRRRELGLPLVWSEILGVIRLQAHRQLAWMAFVSVFILVIWMYQVRLLLALFLGFKLPPTLSGFLDLVLRTPEGLTFLAIGHVDGAILALVTFTLTVVACPLLVDRDLDIVTAMVTSVQAVLRNLGPMLAWAVIVAALLVLGMVPLFLGLIVVLPVLGHATWHLYRRVILPVAPA